MGSSAGPEDSAPVDGGSTQSGHTLAELLVTLTAVGLLAAISIAAWASLHERNDAMQAARLFQTSVQRARMLAVLRGVNHFVVLDPNENTVSVVMDTSTPFGAFDSGDSALSTEAWPASVQMALPPATTSMPSPIGSGAITDAWSLPVPDSLDAWGSELLGVTATPVGMIMSAESTPLMIGSGVVVFAGSSGTTTCVGIRGQFGTVRWYRYDGSTWRVG